MRSSMKALATQAESGFGLVEIMVGMVIGLLGVLAMMQVLSISETQRRNSQGGNDAQNNGAIALYDLQREIRSAGYGISHVPLLGCNVALPNGNTLNNMAPVTINSSQIPAGDANTDTLLLVRGNSDGAQEGEEIRQQPPGVYQVKAAGTPDPARPSTAFQTGDYVIAQPTTPTPRTAVCALKLARVTSVSLPAVSDGNVNIAVSSEEPGSAGGRLYNLGANPGIVAYAVRGGQLTRCDFMVEDCTDASVINDPDVWAPVAGSIASLRAQYGHDTQTPVSTSPPSSPPPYVVDHFDQLAATSDCGWVRTLAVRLVLVARSIQPDATSPTPEEPEWFASSAGNPGSSTAAPIDLGHIANWQKFRYRTFQTVVPIRNITWVGVQAGC